MSKRIIESWREPPNKNILWLNRNDNNIYEFIHDRWVPMHESESLLIAKLVTLVENLTARVTLLEKEVMELKPKQKRSFSKSFNKSFGL